MGRLADGSTIAKRLRTLRGNERVDHLCAMTDVDPGVYRMYERGDLVPREEVRRRLARHFSVSEAELFFAS